MEIHYLGLDYNDRYGSIYLIRNKIPNKKTGINKVYIGQTTQLVHERLYDYKKRIKKKSIDRSYIHNAIKKYGWGNFTCTEILICKSKDELDFCETWIMDNVFNSRDKKFGYNEREGGSHGKHSTKSLKKLSNSIKKLHQIKPGLMVPPKKNLDDKGIIFDYDNLKMTIKAIAEKHKTTETTIRKRLISLGIKPPFVQNMIEYKKNGITYYKKVDYNKIIDLYILGFNTYEISKKLGHNRKTIRDALKSGGIKIKGNYVKIRCIELDKIFNSKTEAAKYFGIHKSLLALHLDKYMSYRGYTFEYLNEKDNRQIKGYIKKDNRRKVYCKELNIFFDSVRGCANYFKISETYLSKMLHGGVKKSHKYNFTFQYA